MTGIAHPDVRLAPNTEPGEREAAAKVRTYHPVIEAYLAEVRRNIHGLVPRDRMDMYLDETVYWIQCRARMLEADGFDEETAIRDARQSHDDPKQLAIALIEEYFESKGDGPLVKRMGRANAIVFTVFGMASAIYFLLLQLTLAFPNTAALDGHLAPALFSRLYPSLLPYPELSWQFILASGYPLVAPFVLGWLSGRLVPVRARDSVLMGLIPIILFSTCASVLLLPDRTGLIFTFLVVALWLPVASQVAHFSSIRLRSRKKTLA